MNTITGKIINILPTERGESQRGQWCRGGFIIEYGEEYPKKALFQVFGEDKVAQFASLPIGTPVTVDYSIEAREYNGKWYNNVSAHRVTSRTPSQTEIQQMYPSDEPAF